MLKKMITKMAKEALKKANQTYKDKAKKIRAGKGTTQEKLDKIEKAGMAFERKKELIKKQDDKAVKTKALADKFTQAQKMMKKKPAVRVSPGGKGKNAPANPIGQMGLRKRKAKGGMGMAMKKKTKYMAKGGMKKTKYMAKGGMKKTKGYARGGAARRK